tara:strand:+ start:706 stop:942 length:237 start_codon:yes stop_codon:yes gene_type:complete
MSLRASKTLVILKKLIELKDNAVRKLNSNGIYTRSSGGGKRLSHIKVPIELFDEIETAKGNAQTFVTKYLDMKTRRGK